MFADISGFTALTEKLSKRGRIGAEEIVETLNRVFGGMLDLAFDRGADLLKFGGDALLLMFRGEGHAERACDAAVEMRIALREAAAVPTSVGRLHLKMSVGIHSGDIHLFLVGEPTRELVVLGPAATSTADAEKAANAGEIIVTDGHRRPARRRAPPARARTARCSFGAARPCTRRRVPTPRRPSTSRGCRPCSPAPWASTSTRDRPSRSTGWPPSASSGWPAPTRCSPTRARTPWRRRPTRS